MRDDNDYDANIYDHKTTLKRLLDLLTNSELGEHLRSRGYDVCFAEVFDTCGMALCHHLGVRSVHALNPNPLNDYVAIAFGMPQDLRHVPREWR